MNCVEAALQDTTLGHTRRHNGMTRKMIKNIGSDGIKYYVDKRERERDR